MAVIALLLAMSAPSNSVAMRGSAALAVSENYDYDGTYLGTLAFGGLQVQYDRALGRGFYVGAMAGYENTAGDSPQTASSHVALIGPTLGGRWGDPVRGGLRVAGGLSYARGSLREQDFAARGWFLDVEGEVSWKISDSWEAFAAFPIIWLRNLQLLNGARNGETFSYVVPIVPFGAAAGARARF